MQLFEDNLELQEDCFSEIKVFFLNWEPISLEAYS